MTENDDDEAKEGELVEMSSAAAELLREVSNAWADAAQITAETNAEVAKHQSDVNLAALTKRLEQREREVRRGFWLNATASGVIILALLAAMGFLLSDGDKFGAALIASHVVFAAGGYGFGITARRAEEAQVSELNEQVAHLLIAQTQSELEGLERAIHALNPQQSCRSLSASSSRSIRQSSRVATSSGQCGRWLPV